MSAKNNKKRVIMVGPALEGLGGISRVAKIWHDSGFFSAYNIKYIPSVTDAPVNRFLFFMKGLFEFTYSLLMRGSSLFYIHTSSYNSFRRKYLFISIGFLFRKRSVLHIHPTHFYHFLSEVNGPERKCIYFLLRRIDVFVVLTDEMKRNIERLFPEKLVRVLRNPVNVEEMESPEKYDRLPNSLLYLGWYIKEKGVYELVDAIEILVKEEIKIKADFYGAKKIEELRDYVEDKGLTEQIRINGWINNSKKLKALYECTALVLPSHSEGIPNVILEAMATKTPIIATLVGGLKEILRDGENAIIAEVNNSLDLSEKILNCLEHKELRERIAANAYREVSIKYDVGVIKQGFGQIVEMISV